MTKSNTPADKAQTSTKAAETTKAAAAPQGAASKGTHEVAEGHQISLKGKIYGAGHRVSAGDFANKADPEGKKGLQRLVDGGELVKASGKASDKASDERAGGGVVEGGGATGAGPSGAQIIAANTGNDPAAATVVAAALGGTEADLVAANADAGKSE